MKQRLVLAAAASVLGLGLCGSALAGTLTRTSAFEYDPTSGLLIREIIEPDSSTLCLVTTYTYDAYGNKTGSTTRNCNGTSSGGVAEAAAPTGNPVFASRSSGVAFAAGTQTTGGGLSWSAGQFPTTSTNALSHQETKEFDPRFGVVTKLTGPNGLSTTWTYDDFGRKTSESRSDGTTTTWTYTICGTCPTYGTYFVTEASTGAPTKTVYFDSLNREIRSEVEGFDGALVRKDTEYDSLGRVARVSKPYFATGTPVWTTYQYDVLGRVIQADEPTTTAGTTRTATDYNGLITTVTVSNAGGGTNLPDGSVQTRTTTKNSQGQVVQVVDTQNGTITYAYDEFGNLETTNAGGVTTTLTYDLRGRKTQMVDPDMGTWQYDYNALGELVWQKDAKNQATTMVYDLLGRMTNRTEPDLVSNWFYDAYQGGGTCTKGKGKLCQVTSDNNYDRTITYDLYGRVGTLSTTIDTQYLVSYAYDAAGRVDTITYPTDFAVQNVYNARGYLWKVQRVNDPDTTVYWQANSQNAAGQVTGETLGNALTTTRTYDALFRMTAVQSSDTGGAIHHLSYSFDAIGNVTQRVDNVQAITENFAYDTLNRLLSASGPGLTTRSFNYNPVGNMTYKSDVGTYTYPTLTAARPHAVTSVDNGGAANSVTASYTYDANGSLTQASGTIYPSTGSVTFSRTLTYTSFNMPSTVAHVQGASTYSYTYTYNADHERVKLVTQRPDDTITSVYLHPAGKGALLYEKETRASDGRIEHKHYVTGGAGLIGVFVTKSAYGTGDGPEMRYYHTDHLGSVAAITNSSGAVLERLSYEAFGERRNANGTPQDRASPLLGVTTDRGFTAHEHLDELNLIHMNGRIYDPVVARFMTSDPFVGGASNLQAFNRYSYVNNSPLMYTDPSGYFLKKLFKSVEKGWKKVWHSEIGRIAVTVAAAYFTAGIVSSAMISSATSGFLAGGGLSTAFVTIGGEAAVFSGLGSALVGAAGGFAAGFVASNGDLSAAAQSAFSGALFAGIDAFYGSSSSYPLSRVFAQTAAGGISAELGGGSFSDGAKGSFYLSALTWGNLRLREAMKSNSQFGTGGPSDGSGLGVCWRGDCDKLAGGRFDIAQQNVRSPLGGLQREGVYFFFGRELDTSKIFDRALAKVMEAFSGPHDYFNSGFWYAPNGDIRVGMSSVERWTGELAINFTTSLGLAAPFAGAALVPEYSYSAVEHIRKSR